MLAGGWTRCLASCRRVPRPGPGVFLRGRRRHSSVHCERGRALRELASCRRSRDRSATLRSRIPGSGGSGRVERVGSDPHVPEPRPSRSSSRDGRRSLRLLAACPSSEASGGGRGRDRVAAARRSRVSRHAPGPRLGARSHWSPVVGTVGEQRGEGPFGDTRVGNVRKFGHYSLSTGSGGVNPPCVETEMLRRAGVEWMRAAGETGPGDCDRRRAVGGGGQRAPYAIDEPMASTVGRCELFADEQAWEELERWDAETALVRFSGGGGATAASKPSRSRTARSASSLAGERGRGSCPRRSPRSYGAATRCFAATLGSRGS